MNTLTIRNKHTLNIQQIPPASWAHQHGFQWTDQSIYLKQPNRKLKKFRNSVRKYWTPELQHTLTTHLQQTKTPKLTQPLSMPHTDYYLMNYGPEEGGYATFNVHHIPINTLIGIYVGETWLATDTKKRSCPGAYIARAPLMPKLHMYTDSESSRNYTAFIQDLPHIIEITSDQFYQSDWLKTHMATANITSDIMLNTNNFPILILKSIQDIAPHALLGFSYGPEYLNLETKGGTPYHLIQRFFTKETYTSFPAVFFRKTTQKKLATELLYYLKQFKKLTTRSAKKSLWNIGIKNRRTSTSAHILHFLSFLSLDEIQHNHAFHDTTLRNILIDQLDRLHSEILPDFATRAKLFYDTPPEYQTTAEACLTNPIIKKHSPGAESTSP